jgi:hypothetical protein
MSGFKVPSRSTRTALFQNAIINYTKQAPNMVPVFRPLLEVPAEWFWQLKFGSRIVYIQMPERGEDGPYIVTISGKPDVLLKGNIDRFATRFGFHRISKANEAVSFTLEWRGGDPMGYADSTAFFVNTLYTLIPSFDWAHNIHE